MSLASTDPAPADVGAMQDALSSLWATLDAVPDPRRVAALADKHRLLDAIAAHEARA